MADDVDSLLNEIAKNPATSQGQAQTTATTPEPGSVDELLSQIHATPSTVTPTVTAETPWSDVLTQGAKALPGDVVQTIGEIAGGVGHAIAHPQQTYESLKGADWSKIGSQMSHDYLTEEGWKQGIAERPFSRALDVGTALAAPEFAAEKLGATTLAKGLRAINPATAVVSGTAQGLNASERLLNSVVGHMGTHTGGESLNLLMQAGLESPEMAGAAYAGLRSAADPTEAVKGFEAAANNIRDDAYTAYRADKKALSQDSQRLDLNPILKTLDEVDRNFSDPFAVVPNASAPTRQLIRNIVETHAQAASDYDLASTRMAARMGFMRYGGPNPLLDPIGFDELKKAIGKVVNDSQGESRAAGNIVRQAVASQITQNAPRYTQMMADYGKMRDALDAYQSELSLGKNPDTALRKLYSSLRNNVTGNFARRWQLVSQLAQDPQARKALYTIAGQANSAWLPRGLIGSFKSGIAPFAGLELYTHDMLSPFLAPLIATQSPQLMGHAAILAGRLGRNLGRIPWRPFIYAGHAAAGAPYGQ